MIGADRHQNSDRPPCKRDCGELRKFVMKFQRFRLGEKREWLPTMRPSENPTFLCRRLPFGSKERLRTRPQTKIRSAPAGRRMPSSKLGLGLTIIDTRHFQASEFRGRNMEKGRGLRSMRVREEAAPVTFGRES